MDHAVCNDDVEAPDDLAVPPEGEVIIHVGGHQILLHRGFDALRVGGENDNPPQPVEEDEGDYGDGEVVDEREQDEEEYEENGDGEVVNNVPRIESLLFGNRISPTRAAARGSITANRPQATTVRSDGAANVQDQNLPRPPACGGSVITYRSPVATARSATVQNPSPAACGGSIMGNRPPAATTESVAAKSPAAPAATSDDDDATPYCAVCQSEIYEEEDEEEKEKVRWLPCTHQFHEHCILPWLTQKNTCPVCRYVLPGVNSEYVE